MASSKFPVAVVGMAVKLPGADSCEEFWQLMINSQDTVGDFPDERAADIQHVMEAFRGKLVDDKQPFFTGSFFKSVDKFDEDVFQINPREALFIEPEQRMFLETVWELLEDAGYLSKIKGSRTGVYVGNTVNKYKYVLTENHPSVSHGNHSPFIASRVSYIHDLQGPAMMVATGCSSSLLAVHLACQGLLSGDCDMAIAGGITLDLLPVSTKTDIWNQLGITGPNVKCRAFDASAKGIAKGEGCGVVILKPLEKALSDGDHIYGILEATTANQDGHSNGITAPHPVAQAKMLHRAWRLANINPANIGYFEAHGTGTELGDPIEISGITSAFRMSGVSDRGSQDKIPIGSVKANIGHLADGAAGIVALIKTLLCLHKNRIPPPVNFSQPNPHINWQKSPVYVNTSPLDWKPHTDETPRLASVSAFGLLGTNIHAVVREHVPTSKVPRQIALQEVESHLLALAANSRHSLVEFIAKIAAYFKNARERTTEMLRSVCFTVNTGREQARFKYRAVAYGVAWDDMMQSLHNLLTNLIDDSSPNTAKRNTPQYASSPNVCSSIVDLKDSILSTSSKAIATDFLSGKKVRWEEVYALDSKNSPTKTPFIPTYAFERARFWPKVGKPINRELLRAEHQLKDEDHVGSDVEKVQNDDPSTSRTREQISADTIVKAALNEALSTSHDWDLMAEENLFVLGLDSLIFTQVNGRLNASIGCDLSMAEFHMNPTFSGLKQLVEAKVPFKKDFMPPSGHINIIHRPDPRIDVRSRLAYILDESLGKKHNWSEMEHDNLFSLGLDSLMYTHVTMKIQDALGLEMPFTMAEFHENPSFSGLFEVMQKRLVDQSAVCKPETPRTLQSTEECTEQLFPVSFAQRRLWVMQEMATNLCAYNATNCLKITGEFHPVAFLRAVNTVLARHGAFFTVFVDGQDSPSQKHNWKYIIRCEEVDLLSASDNADNLVMRLYDEDYKTPFDLQKCPLVRCKLYHLPTDVYFFTMVIHHIIFDGWSHFVFYNQVWDTYKKLYQGKAVEQAVQLPLYVDFAQEEQQIAATPFSRIAADLTYWKGKLSGPLPLTTLPGDKRRPPVFTHNGERITRFVNHDTIQALAKICDGQHTMFMTLLSAVYVLLNRYTGANDLIVGTPIAGRTDLATKHVIGCFINTLVLRVEFDDSLSFSEVLSEVSKVCTEAFDHQNAPFDHLVSELNLPRDTSSTPVFSVNICYHNTEMKSEHVAPPPDVLVERRLLHNNSSKWDMQFDFLQEPEGMRFTLEYYSDVFSDNYANSVVENFLSLLERVTSQPHIAISEWVTGKPVHAGGIVDQQDQLSIISGPTTNIGDKGLSALLFDSLEFHAEDSSVIAPDGSACTYKKLLTGAEKIAVFLRECCHIQSQSRVGLLLDNSPEALESILASMLSGLVYVPMDPASPKPRLEHISKESGISVIIFNQSHTALANHLQWACPSVRVLLCVDGERFVDLQEEVNAAPLMNKELWDRVATKASDDIEGGGWQSSYTGEYISSEEMHEYTENVSKKLANYLTPQSNVLEIGCASGLTTQKLCSLVGHYTATDLSQAMAERLKVLLQKQPNVEVRCMAADHVASKLSGEKFDVIIMNSVVHCFPGHNYMRRVLSDCAKLLRDDGIIFIGDIMDLKMRDKLVHSLKSFKAAHPECRTKTEWQNELFLSRQFLQTLCDSLPTLGSVTFTRKLHTIPNELTEFRFDAVFTKSNGHKDTEGQKGFETFASQDMSQALQVYCSDPTYDFYDLVSTWAGQVQLKDEAYILYTSGTTGTPRGVIIGQEALLNYVSWAMKAYKIDKHTQIPLFSPLTFDFTVTSIFPPLLKGSTIHVYPNFQDSYMTISSNKHLTVAKFSPLQLDTILSTADGPLSVSTFILGGEELTQTLLGKLKQNKPDDNFVVWNEYGPTEATVGCVVKCFRSEDLPLKQSQLVSIGLPIDNVTVAVVRDKTNVVPVGGKGTLCISGKCLCSDFAGGGTSKQFSSSCWGWPGEQMLLTDDIVEMMPADGEMAYFGRQESNTVKVNGIRVDLMEIQQAIEINHLVQSAWISSFAHEGHTYLGAAVKLKQQQQGRATSDASWKQSLISDLTQTLTSRCIPKVFVEVCEPPTNRNGKKDTPLLKSLFKSQIQAKSAQHDGNCGHASPEMAKLQRIWLSILPISHLPNPEEDFFLDLSGDSLQAIHLVRMMQEEGYRVSVTDVFQNPCLRKLIPVLQKQSRDSIQSTLELEVDFTDFRPTPIVEEYFLRERNHPDHFSLSALLHVSGTMEVNVLHKALRSVMKKHGSLRSRFKTDDEGVTQEVIPLAPEEPKIIEANIVREHDHLANEPRFITLTQNLEQSHSLTKGILVNAGLIKFKERDGSGNHSVQTYVLLVVHHAAIDIVSWQQLLLDLASALRKLSLDQSEEPVLAPCSLPFRAYCKALHTEASGIFASEIPYWKHVESQSFDAGLLVADYRQSRFLSAKWFSKSIDATSLRSTANRLGCSDEQILLTAFGRSMASFHGKPKTAICLESHGRQLTTVDSTSTVGWCTTMFPFILDTPLTADIVCQVKQVGKMIREIPNHGLGFGLLKAAGKLSMAYPKVMFVFQGSLDASTKETFDGGQYKFEHIPWIEIMLNELRQGRFHRHPDEILEFDLEIIAWIHGGELKFGCLFDRETISETLVEDVIKRAELNMNMLATRAGNKPREVTVEIIPGFNITPDCVKTVKEALSHHDVTAKQIQVVPPEQALQTLYKGSECSADITVIIPRNETDEGADEFTGAYKQFRMQPKSSQVIVVNAETIPNTAKLSDEVKDSNDHLDLLPEFVGLEFYDRKSDSQFSMPLTQTGYTYLGLSVARTIRAVVCKPRHKVITVDADYTLWTGECAHGAVSFNKGNLTLQEFLLRKKKQGMLLVMLSKNSKDDVERVFETQQEQMSLKKDDFVTIVANWEQKSKNIRSVANQLNLALDAFVFIDDNPLECEEMVLSCPEVITIQVPIEEHLAGPLLENLWTLDISHNTPEASERTEMYRDEFARQKEMQSLQIFDSSFREAKIVELLVSWGMMMTICKTSAGSLKQNKTLRARAEELLSRTNQFKMNDVNTTLSQAHDEDICWLVALQDCHGAYGIISVCLLSSDSAVLNQWVVSCRVLGREVEKRIIHEIYKESTKTGKNTVRLAVNKTARNTPMVQFLMSLGATVSERQMMLVPIQNVDIAEVKADIHNVVYTSDLDFFEDNTRINDTPKQDQTKPTSSNETADEKVNQSRLDQVGLSTWVTENWSQKQKEQAAYHRMFPVIPACTELVSPNQKCGFNDKNNGRAEACKETWMEVLQISQEPEETQNFLACGGDSFKAVFLISKLQRVCGIDISIMDILQKPVYGCFREVVMQAESAKDETGEFQQINSSRHGLSAAQLRMVLMQQTAPDSTAYVETIASYTNITIEPEDVFRSLTLLHPILTSTITMDDDSKDFVIALSDNIVLNVESEMTDDLVSVEDYVRDSTPVIDVLSGPLVKFRHCTRKDATVLVVHVHHVIVDDITLKNILKDLDRLMKGCSSGAPGVQSYSSYVEWEKSHHQSAQHEADKVFWAKTFSSIPPSSSLAILPASETEWSDTDVYRARQTKKHISADSADEIVKYCKSIGVTAFQYYLACTMMVLQRYIGKDDITLAIPVTTRTDVHQSTDGLFVNTVLFRKVLQNSVTFTDYTRDVAKSWMQTHSQSQYPLDEVVRIVREEHGQSASTFCALMFNYATTESSETMKRIPAKHAKMPVSLDVIHDDSAKTVELLVEWADGFIDAGVAERLVDSVASVCCKASKQANSIIKSIETLSSSELDLLESFNQYPEECQTNQQPIHMAFEDHAAKNPDATAVFSRGISVTYKQLNTMAASIAQGLLVNIDQASLREKPVIIVMQKDEYAVASILGIWKAGGHFLPVAVNHQNSLKDVFDRSQPAAVIYNIPQETVSIPSRDKKPCPFLSTKDLITYPPDDQVQIRKINDTPVDSLAYIIKTSGSTGLPKQCKISHRSLGVVAAAWKKKYKMTSMDVNILQWAPISFDVFTGDLVRSLICSPGQLTICPDDFRLDVCHILDLIKKQGITMAEVTPQFGLQLVENAKPDQLESIQLLVLGSDVLQEHVYSRVKNFLKPTQRVVNSYGLTEATIDSSFFEGHAVPRTRSGAVPIGKPLPGVGFHVLNTSTLQPCPVGTVGELYISGDVLASGDVALVQLQHLECSALKTGDAACWLPTGHIDLLGRLDSMVKLRGFRISTTEIENKILRLVPGVKGACVVPMTNDKQSNSAEFLCAFLVLEDNKHIARFKVDRRSVCQRLQAELAYYMLPDVITIIDKVPLTANGKVNHKALPNLTDILEVNDTDVQTVDDTVTETASTLKVLLAEVMGIPDSSRIPSDRTFMELGAHSLILVRFSSILKQQSQFDVKIADLFSYPSISSLADYIDRCMECSSSLNSKPGIIDEGNRLDGGEEMAITGVGLRLPGGIMSLSQLWEALAKGDDLIGEFPKSRAGDVLSCIDISAAEKIGRMDTFEGAFLEQIDQFDNHFFKIAPGEVKYMSPEQRLFLQVATEALAEGTNLSTVKGSKIGVFVGNTEVGYSKLNHPDEAICVSGLMPGMIATRVAYQWDLKGPTMLVDTACSSSLVALQQACDSIRRKECEAALVGGVNLVLYPARTGVFGQTSILSPDFHCRAFDKDASGTAVGEGVLCLYLEPLNKALEEKKAIYGVMKGAAANSVGHGNGITAPTPSSQKEVIHSALKSARLKPSAISFIESHGTGTNLGDKIEISALSSIFKENQQSQKIPVGSAKTTLGHLDSAAGMLGVFKVLASFMYKQIAPNANFNNPNPELAGTSLYVPAKTEAWVVEESSVRVAGVSSFGLTGTNCHVILAESSVEHSKQDKDSDMTSMPLLLSGFCINHIKRQLMVYRAFLKQSRARGLNQLRGLCQTVASRLKELSDASMGHDKWRMVVTARKKLQLLNIMDIIISAADENVVVELAALRSDVFLSCPQQCHVKAASSGIKDFLVTGKIDTSLLFANSDGHVHCVPGVTMAMYSESRHWLEPTSKELIRIIHVEGLLDLLQRKLSETREMVRTLPLTPTKELTEIEGKFCSAIVIQFLMGTDLADYLKANKDVSFKEAFTFTVMHTKYEKLFFVMIRELWLNHLVQATGSDDSIHRLDSFKFTCKTFQDNDPETIATYAVEKYPSWADCFRFPLYCSKHLDKVLRGNMSPLSVIYPQGDLNFMYQFDKLGDMLGDVYYNMYMQIIAEYAKQLSSRGQKVRVLEVGAGVGHVTRQLLPKLKSTPGIEYWFTDLGKAFVEHAKVLFSDYLHMMKLCTFDITKNAPAQGVLGSFDIVISYNVIHTTQSVMDSVVNLKSCLGDDGTLFIIESARNDTWATLAWGLLDGWWYFKDYDLRPAEPMMEPEKWEKVLQEVGFGSVHTCPVEETERNHVEKFLFLCSTKPLISSNIEEDPKLGWWENDARTFDPVKTYTELEIEVGPEGDSEEEGLVDREVVFLELTKIWSELLGIDNIQADDDFNSLGGESLLAIQMMKLVRKRIGYQLEIADTFGYPTLGSLANFIADMMTEKKASLKDDSGLSTPCNGLDADGCDDRGKDDNEIKPSTVEVSWVRGRTIKDEEERALEANQQDTMLMFPGQGAQKLGMCISMKDSPEAKAVFKRAEVVLGYNILDICLKEDTELQEKLQSTEFVQVALLVGCLAKLEQLKVERLELMGRVTSVAGLSVGEFVALVYAGVISFEDAVTLVRERGRAMEKQVRASPTGMVSVFGPTCEQLQEFLGRKFPAMKISTYLADNQHTIAGTNDDCSALVAALSTQGEVLTDVIDVRKLHVAGAFHSVFMQTAADVVDPIIESVKFSKPNVPIIMNVSGEAVSHPAEIKSLIRQQLVGAVKWRQSVVTAYESGVRHYVEVAPGRVLSSIVKKRIAQCQDCTVELIIV